MTIEPTAVSWRAAMRAFLAGLALALVSTQSAAISLYCALAEVESWHGTISIESSVSISTSDGQLWAKRNGATSYSGTYNFANSLGQCVDDPEYTPTPGAVETAPGATVPGTETGGGSMNISDNYCEGLELGVWDEEEITAESGAVVTGGERLAHLVFDFGTNTYSVDHATVFARAAVRAKRRHKDCSGAESTSDTLLDVGAPVYPSGIPIPSDGTLSGEWTFKEDGWTYKIQWSLAANARPAAHKNDTVSDPCKKKGSIVGCENQSLGETIPVTGTPFALNYRSDRVEGRLRADPVGVLHAKELAGWTLTPYHRYDPVGNKLFLGNGERRDAAALGTVKRSPAGGFLIADEGNQVYEFGADGAHSQTRHALTGAVLYQFAKSAGRLVSITDAYNNITSIQRDSDGRPTAIVAPFGQVTSLTTDASGYLAHVTNPAGGGIQLQSSATGLLNRFTRPNGLSSIFDYDAEGRLVRDTAPTGAVQTLGREGTSVMDFAITHTSAEGLATRFDVSRSSGGGDTRKIVNPDGLTTTVRHGGGMIKVTTPDGVTSHIRFGDDPRFGKTGSFSSSATLNTDDGRGLNLVAIGKRTATLANPDDPFSLIRQIDTLTINGMADVELPPGSPPMPPMPQIPGRTYTTQYDAATRTSTLTMPSGAVSKTVMDDTGRPLQVQEAGLAAQTFAYDTYGRLTRASIGSGTEERFLAIGYDAGGWLSSVDDSLGQAVQFTRDALGQVVKQQLPGGRTLRFAYDADSHMTMLTVPSGAMHRFNYDKNGLLSAYAAPGVPGAKTITRYSYDLDRKLKRLTRPDGTSIDFGYDTTGRLSTIATPHGQYRYAYSPTTGNLSSIDAPSGVRSAFTYDGNVLTGETWSGAITGAIGLAYDNEFRVQTIALNGVDPIALTYDIDGRLSATGELTLTRDAGNGLLTGSKIGGVDDHFDYDPFGRVSRYEASALGTVLLAQDYTYDLIGRIVSVTESSGGPTTRRGYQYDAAGRLGQVTTNDTVAASYQYDANGNRTMVERGGVAMVATFDAQDRLKQFGDVIYAYTDAGELKTKTQGSHVTQYGYDTRGNLLKVVLPSGETMEYLTDGSDRRIGKKRNGVLVQGLLYLDQLKPAAELDGAGNVVSHFVYATHANVPDYMAKGGHVYRIVSDHLGSPRRVVDVADGTITQLIEYDEWGQVLADSNPGFQPFGFAGGLRDMDTGLARFGARDYDAEAGRWIAKDPLLFEGGDRNLYAYANGDPINNVDPTGTGKAGCIQAFIACSKCDASEERKKCLEEHGDITQCRERGEETGNSQTAHQLGKCAAVGKCGNCAKKLTSCLDVMK